MSLQDLIKSLPCGGTGIVRAVAIVLIHEVECRKLHIAKETQEFAERVEAYEGQCDVSAGSTASDQRVGHL